MWRDDAYLLDMLLAARRIQRFNQGATWEQFQREEITQQATMRMIQILGEAARMVSPTFKASHPEIPWQAIIGMRHRLVHEYFRVIPEKVWEVVERDIPKLIAMIEPLVPPDEPQPGG